jgi:monoamine oxidase
MTIKQFGFFLIFVFSTVPLYCTKVVIIGAGLAGLTTAYRLKKEGFEVEIYEARPRPVGRVFTCYFPDGYQELGGMNIHDAGEGSGTIIKALADELGVPYIVYRIKRDLSYVSNDGQVFELKDIFSNAPKPTHEKYVAFKQYANIGEVLDAFLGKEDSLLKSFLILRSQDFDGCDSHDLSMLDFDSLWLYYCANYQYFSKREQIDYDFCSIKNGMCNLIEALCNSLEGCIHYNMPLKRIMRKKDNEFILYVGDKQVAAKKIVLTLPCSTLRDVVIDEGIVPEDQMHMIKTLQYGTNAKMFLLTEGYSSRYSGAHSDCMMYYEKPILWFYFGGSKGIFDDATKEGLSAYLQKQMPAIQKLYPGLSIDTEIMPVPATTKPFVHLDHGVGISWINELYSKGSYSCVAPGQEVAYEQFSDYHGEKIRTVFRPIEDAIFFAGEHTSLENTGTLDGAVESGERAAKMVMHALNLKLLSTYV